MSQSNDFPHDPFEEHVTDLLSRTARVARPNPALGQQVRQRLTNDSRSLSQPRSAARFWPIMTQFGSIAVATLIVGAVVAVLLTQGGKAPRHIVGAGTGPVANATATSAPMHDQACNDPTPGGPTHYPYTLPPDHSVVINKSATSNGLRITLDRAYADATQTVILLHVTGGATAAHYDLPNMFLTDASGKQYPSISNGDADSLGYRGDSIALFPPLPQSELGAPQRLNFTSGQLTQSASTGAWPTVTGAWSIPFTITPVAGTTITVTLPAQTHDGLTIQVESVDIAPAGGGLDGLNGGARIHVRISGLPQKMVLTDLPEFSTAFWEGPSGGGWSSSPGTMPGAMGCPELDLQYFPGQPLLPGIIEVNGDDVLSLHTSEDPTTWPKVGPSGTADMDVLFYGPFKTGSGSMTLTFDGIRISTPESGMVNGLPKDLRVAHGPWIFDIPLQQP
ncbi:MAG TPA: DUF4179 domain-containing protein [Ktedonobacterales bacterium]